MSKKAVRHGAVKKGRDDATVQISGVALVLTVTRELRIHLPIGVLVEDKAKSLGMIGTAKHALCMQPCL